MEEKKVIKVDVDGVLRDLMAKCCFIYKRDIDPKSTATPNDIVDWDFDPVFPKLPEAHKVFFGEYAGELFLLSDPYETEMAKYMGMIKEEGEVIIATDQPNGAGKYTLEWLENNRVPYDGIFISSHKTLLKGDIALDDRLKNLELYRKEGTIAVCMERPWNHGRWNGPIVHSLSEFYLFLQDLKQK
jgi:5'(3')-deoxyribonucleotidase